MNLYHYTSFDTFVKIWLSGKLRFGEVQNVNDIQEYGLPISAPTYPQRALILKFDELRLKYKQISLAMDFDDMEGCMSTLMWAYYADKSKGVCIRLDSEKIDFSDCLHSPVTYNKTQNGIKIGQKISTTSELRKFIIDNKEDIFFTKYANWDRENEYRIVSDKLDYLDISEAITGIYLTSYKSMECVFVEELVNEKVDIFHLDFKRKFGVPKVRSTKEKRLEWEKLSKDPNQLRAHQQVREFLERNKDDEDASLLM